MLRYNENWDWFKEKHEVEEGYFGHAFMDQASRWGGAAASARPALAAGTACSHCQAGCLAGPAAGWLWVWHATPHPPPAVPPLPAPQTVISEAVASQRLGHPSIHFTLRPSKYLKPPDGLPQLIDTLRYQDPGVHLQYPPEWHALAGGAEANVMG